MNTKLFIVAGAVIFALVPAIGWGQSGYGYGHAPGFGYGYAYGNGYSHASTYEEGVLNGYSNYLQGRGLYEKYHTDAMISFQQARALSLQNDLAANKARLEALDLRKQRVAEETRDLAERNRFAQLQRPLTSVAQRVVQPDGQLNWPAELQGKEFAAFRAAIDAEFAELAAGNAASAVTIKNHLDRLVEFASVKVRSQSMSGTHLTAAIAFRDKAANAARQWTNGVNGVQATVVSASY